MLIITEKHTKEDLELYAEYQKIDRIVQWSRKKRDLSIAVIKAWAETHSDVVAYTSWGKDSVVLLSMIVKLGLKIPVVWMRFSDRENPCCDIVRDKFLESNDIDYHEESFVYNDVIHGDRHWKILANKYGHHRLSGIRNDESGKRLLQFKLYGFESKNSCRPLALWTNKEIFAYIEQTNLPLNPVYGFLGGGRWPREHLRTHSLAGKHGNGMGRDEWEKEYFLSELNRIK
jgi:3'-phosphoadenosine 5'-phosphosulfate sulfotransferase (PAPS reductase)/FAD synthetase